VGSGRKIGSVWHFLRKGRSIFFSSLRNVNPGLLLKKEGDRGGAFRRPPGGMEEGWRDFLKRIILRVLVDGK